MALSKRMQEEISRFCGSASPEDGTDPREFHQFRSKKEKKADHKQLRLCRQVAQTVSLAISECPKAQLRELLLESVIPAAGSAPLLVTLRAETSDIETCEMLRDLLGQSEGWFRAEVAKAISRKRVPRLSFAVIPSMESTEQTLQEHSESWAERHSAGDEHDE